MAESYGHRIGCAERKDVVVPNCERVMVIGGEPQVDRAIALEEKGEPVHAHGAAPRHHGGGMAELSRSTQKVGLFFATGLSGCFVGGIFGLVFAFLRGRLSAKSDWSRSLSLAAALFVGAALLAFLKYPANPLASVSRPP